MKKRIVWFATGFVVSWLTWSVVAYIRLRPRDYTEAWSADQQELAPDWLKKANGRQLGHFLVFTPADTAIAAAYIHPPAPNPFPGVLIQDQNADGRLDSILVADSTYQYVSLDDKTFNGVFDSLSYSTALKKDSMSFTDNNMDGQYDMRLGPGPTVAVAIDGQWHDLIRTNKATYVEINGKLTEVRAAEGIWTVLQDK